MATTLLIDSREYKLPLAATRFLNRTEAGDALLDLVRFVILDQHGGHEVKPADSGDSKLRQVRYLDTTGQDFRAAGFILRLRQESEGKFALNLKARSPDRYLAADADVSFAGDAPEKKTEFEEDVLPPFGSQFSHSTSAKKIAADPTPSTVAGAAELFPVLGTLGLEPDLPVAVSDRFTAHEVERKGGTFRFGDGPEVEAGFTFWYLREARTGFPLLAELSFGLKAPMGDDFPVETVRAMYDVFRALQAQGAAWLDPSGTTKSAFAAGGT
ncbi:MAG TPA: hypothetical protein VJT67_01290 [Longimicrobiaceae bacterium]|nr:hypothetical protein [Longimicrobiaceae bacterium]